MSTAALPEKFSILIAGDDADDRELLNAAFDEQHFHHNGPEQNAFLLLF